MPSGAMWPSIRVWCREPADASASGARLVCLEGTRWCACDAYWRGRSGLPLLLGLPVLLAGCTSIAGPTTTFGDIFWSFVAFFFWFMAIWIFITIFGDIFRRNDLTGGMKAVWIIVLIILPFLGAIIYMVDATEDDSPGSPDDHAGRCRREGRGRRLAGR